MRRRAALAGLVLALAGASVWAAKPSLRVFFASDFTDVPYQQKAVNQVMASWKPPAEMPKAGSKAVVITTILRDGKLLEARLHYESGSKAWDAAALAAVHQAAPFPPLPKRYAGSSVEAHFHFEVVEK
jgi:protein TonB